MSMEGWKTIFDWSAVVLLFLTFVSGFGALITGNIINKRQDEHLRQFDKDLTEAKTELGRQQERAAKAEMELLRQGARENLIVGAARDKLIAALKPFAGQSAEVRYGRSTYGVLQNFPETAGPDARGLADSLIAALREAQWAL